MSLRLCPEQGTSGSRLSSDSLAACRDAVTEPLIPPPAGGVGTKEPAQTTVQQPSPSNESDAAALPSQMGTIKILALVLLVVALLVTAAALLSKSGVVQPGGPPPECRKSASLSVLRQEQAAPSANPLASNAGLLQLIVWGGKGKKAQLVFADSHLLNLQDHKWRLVRQKAGLLLQRLHSMPGLRNIWKSSPSRQALHTDPARLPAARWKQLSVTDPDASSMVIFGGDGLDAGNTTSSNGHNYFNDAWQVSLDNGKARWQNLWNTGPPGMAVAVSVVQMQWMAACYLSHTVFQSIVSGTAVLNLSKRPDNMYVHVSLKEQATSDKSACCGLCQHTCTQLDVKVTMLGLCYTAMLPTLHHQLQH